MIPAIQELNFPKKDGKQYATLTHATATLADMGEKTITTQVKIDGEIVPDFSYDWEVVFQGEKYIMPLRIPQGAKENTSLNATIDLTFQHWAIYQLKRWPFVTMQPIEAGTAIADKEVASVQLNLKDFCDLFGQVLEYYYGGTITIDLNPAWGYDNTPTLITIDHTYIWNVLIDAFHGKYGVRWAIEPREDNDNSIKGGERYVVKVGYPTTKVDHIFEYGFEGGLLKLERQVQSEDIRNMIKGRGGETNIPFRYFKDVDPKNPDFKPDPDWVEELANIYFTNLRGATFRSYIQGWKAAHISKYPGYKAVGESNAYAPWAYRKGFTDTKFHPEEFVADEITINPGAGDRQIEILPGYSPDIKKGSSIDKYGPLPATLDNNDDIYPTLQGTGLDVAVDVEQIESDDVAGSIESDATAEDKTFAPISVKAQPGHGTASRSGNYTYFTVPAGKTANIEGHGAVTARNPRDHADASYLIAEFDYTIKVFNAVTGAQHSASGIPEGRWYFTVDFTFNNTGNEVLNVTCAFNGVKIVSATPSEKWTNTFNLWVKNIWGSERQAGETDSQYAERVWKPVLGDQDKNTAKVVFTSGALLHEDYEFTIVGFPIPDSSKSYDGEQSHWRLKLAKSEAELEATGLYVPSTQKQGKAGDTFVFFGTEMAHVPYVVDAEVRLDDWKKDHLGEVKEIKPTFVITTDRVRLNNEGKANSLIGQLRIGNSIRLADKRFIQTIGDRAYETLYLQSLTYTYREPSSDDAALNPDVEIVLGNEYASTANPVSVIQGEISSIQRLLGSISNVEQIVRAVGDRLYLRKEGISDRSLSPTQFFSLLTSEDFRAGLIGGTGWGFYKDENGNWVLEADRVNVRQEFSVNTLVINQAEGRSGMEVDTAAFMEVTRVDETYNSYVCYFDQKDGSVANLFHVDDVAYCNRWTPENQELKFYKRRVVAVGVDNITLTKGYDPVELSDGTIDTGVNGEGIPAEKDSIIHFGNYTDKMRQYVKVRDVVGGGYECYLEGLDSVNATGVEFYFVGRRAGESARWFIGDRSKEYIEWKNGELSIRGRLSVLSTVGDKTLGDFVRDEARVAQYSIDCDNEVIGIACNAAGEVIGSAYPPCTVSVYKGSERVTEGVVYGIDVADGVSATVSEAGVVTFSRLESATARVSVRAEIDGVVLRCSISLYKAIPGGKVQEAKTLYSTVFTATQPAASTFTLSSVPSVPAGMYLWSVVVTSYTDGTVTRAYSGVRQGLDYGAGKMLFNDPTFKKGANGVQPYYHASKGGSLIVRRIDDDTAPNDSGKVLHIESKNVVSPGVGGFAQGYMAAPNKVFVRRVIARIPKGYTVKTASTSIGWGGARYALTPMEGTGKWEEYVHKFVCGSKEPFSVFGYFYLEGPQGTNESPVEWDVAYVTLFDMGANGDFQVAEKSVTYAKSTSSAQPADSAFVYGSINEAGPSVGDYLWTRTSVTYSDGTTVTSYSVGRIGSDGTNGLPGAPGADGRTTYVHYAYANSEDGSEDFSREYFAGAKYVGVRTDYDREDPEDWRLYEWARLRGEDARVYSLLVSAGSVRRGVDGSLSPSRIGCQKMLTVGEEAGSTTDYYLYYKFVLGEESAANWVIGAGPGSSAMGETAIPSNAREVVFELRTTNTANAVVLDRESVPVLTDAADMEVGGTNLLKNSDFIDGVRYWTNNVVDSGGTVAVLDRATAPGWLEGRATMHVRYASGTATWRSLYQRIAAGKVRAGEVYMLSGWVYVPSIAAMTKTVYAKIHRELTDGSSYNQELIDFRGVTAGRWCYVSKMWKAPATLDMSKDVWVMFQLEQYGEFYLNGWKFEKGNVATGWSASPEDVSYLRTALRESTTIDGGLIAATLLKLGYTLEGGEYRVTAGMNGVVTPDADDIAFWSGGGMVDAEKEPDSEDAATFVIRHSGEAYACRNTVRFKSNRIEVGAPGARKSVVLDDDGLKLVDGSEERLRVVHQSVGSLADAASSQLISGPGVKSHVIYLRQLGGGSSLGGIQARKSYQISRGFETAAFSVGSSGATLNAGAAIKMTARVGFVYDTREETSTPGIYDSYPLSGSMRVRIYSTAGTVLCNRSVALRTTDGRNHVAELSLNETVKTAGVYLAKIYLEGVTTGSGSDAGAASASVSASGSVQLGYADQTIMGSDGFMTKWGNAALLARAGEVHAKVGTTELLVLESGIKAIVNGKETWLAGG